MDEIADKEIDNIIYNSNKRQRRDNTGLWITLIICIFTVCVCVEGCLIAKSYDNTLIDRIENVIKQKNCNIILSDADKKYILKGE